MLLRAQRGNRELCTALDLSLEIASFLAMTYW